MIKTPTVSLANGEQIRYCGKPHWIITVIGGKLPLLLSVFFAIIVIGVEIIPT